MYPKKITAVLLVISITLFSHNSIFAAQDPSVVQSIGFFQTTDPYLPFSNDLKKQKGNMGYILGQIFNSNTGSLKGKIKGDYIDFTSIQGATTSQTGIVMLENSTGSTRQDTSPTSNILKSVWDYVVNLVSSVNSKVSIFGVGTASYLAKFNGLGQVADSIVYDNAINIGIGTTNPQAKLDVAGGIRVGNDISTCVASNAGTIRYYSGATEVCNGTSWSSIGGSSGSVPAGSVMAFNLSSCPTGWSEYTPARGRFLRGIDSTGTNDIVRVVGDIQADDFKSHYHYSGIPINSSHYSYTRFGVTTGLPSLSLALSDSETAGSSDNSNNGVNVSSTGGTETRPKNVAVLYCQKDTGTGDTTDGVWKMSGSNIYNNNVGNVGIGTNAPSEKLEVSGNIKATAFYYSSDRRLKENIIKINNSLEKINKLNGYTFDWKNDGRKDIGVIAQEVEKVFPQAVKTSETTGYKSVEYGNLVAPIIEAIKELSYKIENLFNKYLSQEEKINKLQKQNLDFLKRLEKLENNSK